MNLVGADWNQTRGLTPGKRDSSEATIYGPSRKQLVIIIIADLRSPRYATEAR